MTMFILHEAANVLKESDLSSTMKIGNWNF